jgi:hypothetical protein
VHFLLLRVQRHARCGEQVPEVEVLVWAFAFRRVVSYIAHFDVERRGVEEFSEARVDPGLLDCFPKRGASQGAILGLEVPAGRPPHVVEPVVHQQQIARRIGDNRGGRHMPWHVGSTGQRLPGHEQFLEACEPRLLGGVSFQVSVELLAHVAVRNWHRHMVTRAPVSLRLSFQAIGARIARTSGRSSLQSEPFARGRYPFYH